MRHQSSPKRRGSIIPFTAIALVAMVGFVALAIDLGMLMLSRTQCQSAADAAALTGARMLTGDATTDYNRPAAAPAAITAATTCSVLMKPVPAKDVTVSVGSYRFDLNQNKFVIDPAGKQASDAWSLVQATVQHSDTAFFAKIFNVTALSTQAISTAAHRPRDVAVVVDFSGSMRFSSILGGPYLAKDSTGAFFIADRTASLNDDPNYPRFGHYSSSSANLRYRGPISIPTGELMHRSNLVDPNTGQGPAVIDEFYRDSIPFGATQKAFAPASAGFSTSPAGDNAKRRNRDQGSTWAYDVNDYLNRNRQDSQGDIRAAGSEPYTATGHTTTNKSTTFETNGYPNFRGYTQGPSYWGKTFFLWPPDPRGATNTANGGVNSNNGARDWRKRFFVQVYLGQTKWEDKFRQWDRPDPGGGGGGGSTGGGSGGGGGGTG